MKKKVYVVIEQREVPYEFTDYWIRGVFSSEAKAKNYCKENPLEDENTTYGLEREYFIEEHELE